MRLRNLAAPLLLVAALAISGQGCGADTSLDSGISTEEVIVNFFHPVTDSFAQDFAARNGLIIRYKSSFVPSYKFSIDRSVTPRHVTAAMVAQRLLSAYPDLIRHAEPESYGQGYTVRAARDMRTRGGNERVCEISRPRNVSLC